MNRPSLRDAKGAGSFGNAFGKAALKLVRPGRNLGQLPGRMKKEEVPGAACPNVLCDLGLGCNRHRALVKTDGRPAKRIEVGRCCEERVDVFPRRQRGDVATRRNHEVGIRGALGEHGHGLAVDALRIAIHELRGWIDIAHDK